MNYKNISLTVGLASALLMSGCSKESTPAAEPAASATNATLLTTTTVVKAAGEVVNAATPAVASVTNAAVATATNATPSVNGVQATLEQVRTLIAQKKYSEAATTLASLRNQNLSTEQQTPLAKTASGKSRRLSRGHSAPRKAQKTLGRNCWAK